MKRLVPALIVKRRLIDTDGKVCNFESKEYYFFLNGAWYQSYFRPFNGVISSFYTGDIGCITKELRSKRHNAAARFMRSQYNFYITKVRKVMIYVDP